MFSRQGSFVCIYMLLPTCGIIFLKLVGVYYLHTVCVGLHTASRGNSMVYTSVGWLLMLQGLCCVRDPIMLGLDLV
jgi:hypothetical protein